jgi:sarcosine oxidase subunit beta
LNDVELAAYEPDSGYGEGAGVANDFLSSARGMGVTYVPRILATRLRIGGGQIRGVATETESIDAHTVVLATGPWTGSLLKDIGCDLPLEAEFHHVAILKNAAGMRGGGSACIDSGTATYFRSDGGDKFLVGDFYGQRGVDPDHFPQSASDESLEPLIDRACRRVPVLENAEVMRGVTGVYDMTPDSRPMLGEIRDIKGLHICAGFSGMGFKISPAIGVVMSELLLEGNATSVEISSFRPSRFADGKPIRAEYEYQDD